MHPGRAVLDVMDTRRRVVENGEPSRLERTAARSRRTAKKARERAALARESHASVDVGFRTAERQRRVAAMVLAGGIAYRILFWLLALSVVIGGVLGFFDPTDVQDALEHHGVTAWAASAVSQFARSSDGNEWWLLLTGSWLVLWTGYTCSKALVLAHATIWGIAPPRIDRPLRASLLFSGVTLGFVAAMAGARWVREQDTTAGLAATMLVFGIAFGFWLVVSHRLPNGASGWPDLVPGAVIVSVGLQAMYVFTSYFLGPKLSSATQLYGVVGVVTTCLFWFYIGGRLIIAAATLDVEFTATRAVKRAGETSPRGGWGR